MKQVNALKELIVQPEIKIKSDDKLDIISARFDYKNSIAELNIDLGKIFITRKHSELTTTQKIAFDTIEDTIASLVQSIINV